MRPVACRDSRTGNLIREGMTVNGKSIGETSKMLP